MNNTIGMAYALGEKSLKDNTLIPILFYCLKKYYLFQILKFSFFKQ